MINIHHGEKLINALVLFSANTQFCGKIKLMKLLYFLDFTHFKETGKADTGMVYDAWEMGPVPAAIFEELSGVMRPDLASSIKIISRDTFQKIVPLREFDGKYFTKRERRILADLAFIFEDAQADEMIESTHLFNSPWFTTKTEKAITGWATY